MEPPDRILRPLRLLAALRSFSGLRARPRGGRGAAALCLFLAACGPANSPHPAGEERSNTLFTAFTERSPKYLDPTSSYSTDETPYTYQIYEPPYRYHYLKRPYVLEPRAAAALEIGRAHV